MWLWSGSWPGEVGEQNITKMGFSDSTWRSPNLAATSGALAHALETRSHTNFTCLYFAERYSAVNLRYFSWMITPKAPLTPPEGHILICQHLHPLFLHDIHDHITEVLGNDILSRNAVISTLIYDTDGPTSEIENTINCRTHIVTPGLIQGSNK